MLKKYIQFIIFLFLGCTLVAQNNNETIFSIFHQNDNLEGFYYKYIDLYVANKMKLSPNYLEKALTNQWREPVTSNEKIAKLHLLINEAYYLKREGAINKSIFIYEKALKFYKNNIDINQYRIITYCLKPLANNYTRIGDYKRAEELLKYTISIAKKLKKDKEVIASYLNLSILFQSIGEFNKAISILNDAILFKPKKEQLASIYSQIAKNKLMLNNNNEAYKTVKKSIYLDVLHKNEVSNNATLASYFKENNEYEKALIYLNKNLKLIQTKRQKAKTLIQIASVYSAKGDKKKSLSILNEALAVLLPSFKPKSLYSLPNMSFYYPENTIKEALDAKAKLFSEMHKIKSAIAHYNASFVVENLLRNTYLSQRAKILQQIENRDRSEKVIALYDILYHKLPSDSILHKMIETIELTKSKVLSNAIQTNQAINLIKEDSLVNQYHFYKSEIAKLDTQIQLESLRKTPNISILENLNAKKTDLVTDFSILIKKSKSKYPFFDEGYTNESIPNLIYKLTDLKQNIFYYFNTNKFLYIFQIYEKGIKYRRIENSINFKKELNDFIALFSDGSPDKIENDINKYKLLATSLHQKLIGNDSLSKTQNYTIIPDKLLNFLPFDALLTKNTTSNNFSKLPYLIKSKSLNYGFSLTILFQLKMYHRNPTDKNLIGFFPVFENNHRNKKTLNYTKIEKQKIATYYNGLFLEGKEASKRNFFSKTSNYSIIHLSTHANAGDVNTPASIEFYDSTLFLPEIYGLHLNSNLIVLSACETGIGKLEKGEGVMSLSRGFSYAGIPNLIVSQWKVNDKSTSILMGNFYENLKENSSISFSLQKAKLDYLQSDAVSMYKKNPYYWSGFLFLGNATKPIIHKYTYLYYLIGFAVVFLLFFLFKKKKI